MHLFAVVVLYIVAQVVVELLAQLLFAVDSVAVVLLLWLRVYMGAFLCTLLPLTSTPVPPLPRATTRPGLPSAPTATSPSCPSTTPFASHNNG